MKSINFLLFIIILPLLVQGQQLNGTYKSGTQYIHFEKDTATFLFETGGCLVYKYEASGKFEILNNHLIIHPLIDNPLEDITRTIRQSKDSLSIEVLTVDNEQISPSLVLYDNKKKAVHGEVIGSGHKTYLSKKYIDFTDSITIGLLSYIPVALKINKNYDYKIILHKGKIKVYYEQFLNSNSNGFKIKIKKDKVYLYRPEISCKDTNYFWQTFVHE